MLYAIVDIETTGGYALNNRITEIAIYFHNGEAIIDSYETLINPERPIPPYITGLTGIDDKMVAQAPTFEEVAEELYKLLEGKIFVAHNVNFDYSFIKKEFEMVGMSLHTSKLCTVRLSRKLIPGLRSYGLGNLSQSLGIEIEARHRAAGDAHATAKIFHMLLERDQNGVISGMLKRSSKEHNLPPNLPRNTIDQLPKEPGVYYFHDQRGTVIYVGKAIDIQKRIIGHFTGNRGTWSNENIRSQIHDISYELTGNELIALLLENEEILRIWPKYNKAQKVFSNTWAIYSFEDQRGYTRFNVGKTKKNFSPIATFHTHAEAWSTVQKWIDEFKLCPKLSGIQTSNHYCFDYELGKCDGACGGLLSVEEYNQRVEAAIGGTHQEEESLVLFGAGRSEEERGFVWLERGEYRGFGFIPTDDAIMSPEGLEPFIRASKDNRYSQQVIASFLTRKDYQVMEISGDSFQEYNR